MSKPWNRVLLIVATSLGALTSSTRADIIAYYSFDGGQANLGKDSSGNGYDLTAGGTNTSGTTGALSVAGNVGSGAAYFNGSDDVFTIAATKIFPAASATSPYSIDYYAEVPAAAAIATPATGSNGNNNGTNIERPSASGVGINLNVSGTSSTVPTYRATEGAGSTLNSGQAERNAWDFVVVTFDGNTLSIYVNNILKNHLDGQAYVAATSGLVGIGARGTSTAGTGAAGTFFNGTIDELAFYNQALTTDQISALYSGQTPLQVIPEPSSIGLICGSGLLMLRRKRRAEAAIGG